MTTPPPIPNPPVHPGALPDPRAKPRASALVGRLKQMREFILDGTILGVGSADTCIEAADTITRLQAALDEILGPLKVCADNPNVGDDVCLPIDITMGELRKARAALRSSVGGE